MQADILGASALGIRNLLCLSGDHQQFGDHPQAKGVFDIDSTQLIGMVKKMRDDAKFLGGADIDEPPKIFIGGAANPFAEPHEWRVQRLAKKVKSGVDFVQTPVHLQHGSHAPVGQRGLWTWALPKKSTSWPGSPP